MNAETPVKELIDVLEAGFSLQEAIDVSLEDKKVSLIDFPNFFSFFTKLPAAINNIQAVKGLYPSFTEAQKAEVLTYVNEKFDIENDEAEVLIEETVEEIANIIQLSGKWTIYRKQRA